MNCTVTGTAAANSAAGDYRVHLVGGRAMSVRLTATNPAVLLGAWLGFCRSDGRGRCATSYEDVGSTFTVEYEPNRVVVGDSIIIVILNSSGTSTPYTLDVSLN